MNKKLLNTKKSGIARVMIYKTDKIFRAVCLDFDLIEEADSYDEVEEQIRESVEGYVENICKNDLDDELLNRQAPLKYWKRYRAHLRSMEKERPEKKCAWSFSVPVPSLVDCSICRKV